MKFYQDQPTEQTDGGSWYEHPINFFHPIFKNMRTQMPGKYTCKDKENLLAVAL